MNSPITVVCPVCSEALFPSGRSYTCPNRHNFDLTKEGYLSLLHGRSNYQHIGDDKLMVQARLRVHKLPPYVELAKAIGGICPQADIPSTVLDIGCGDGFFLSHVVRDARIPSAGVGVDISKEALANAARSFPELSFIRADAAHERLPFGESSFGLVMSIFAPRPIEEVRRVLTPDGFWLIATATQDHLREVRQFLPLAAIGAGKLDAATNGSFSVIGSFTLARELEVARPDLVSVVEMSPSIHRLRREYGEKWTELVPEELKVTFSFSVALLRK